METRERVLQAMLELEYMVGPSTRQIAHAVGLKANSAAYRWVLLLKDDGLVEEIKTAPRYSRYVLTDDGRKAANELTLAE